MSKHATLFFIIMHLDDVKRKARVFVVRVRRGLLKIPNKNGPRKAERLPNPLSSTHRQFHLNHGHPGCVSLFLLLLLGTNVIVDVLVCGKSFSIRAVMIIIRQAGRLGGIVTPSNTSDANIGNSALKLVRIITLSQMM